MKTRVLTALALAFIIIQAQAQPRHSGRESSRNYNSYGNAKKTNHHPGVRVVIAPPVPCVRVFEPTIVIGRRHCRPEPVREHYTDALTEDEFVAIKHRLDDMTFDRERIEYIDRKLDLYYFTSRQVYFMVNSLAVEQNRLDIAKSAYSKTVDPSDYNIVFEALEYESSKHNLDDYLENHSICRR